MKKLVALFMILLMVAVVFVGCQTTATTADTTAAATTAAATTAAETEAMAAWTITISGIGDKDISFTDADAAKMSTVEITATKKKKDGSEVEQKWTGIPLKAILDFYGAKDYSMVKAEASDGYSADLDKAAVEDAGTILGLKLDGQALSKDDGFVQIVAKSLPAKSWVQAVVKITVVK